MGNARALTDVTLPHLVQAPDVRRTLRSLRDLGRVPEGAPAAPDLMSVVQEGVAAASGSGSGGAAASSVLSGVTGAVRSWGVEGTAGAVVKAGARVALEAAARL
jgi:ubiquinone biosynthesis monooxygenase Coq7